MARFCGLANMLITELSLSLSRNYRWTNRSVSGVPCVNREVHCGYCSCLPREATPPPEFPYYFELPVPKCFVLKSKQSKSCNVSRRKIHRSAQEEKCKDSGLASFPADALKQKIQSSHADGEIKLDSLFLVFDCFSSRIFIIGSSPNRMCYINV